ncbi:type II toxin-antitoxin system HicA family toxin [Pantoea ananatis]|uniref:type II toxin-antitoxin system HicA family toxin n=1 Tax=Pantoea ananas TaxID=553 RepID=UPI0032ECD347
MKTFEIIKLLNRKGWQPVRSIGNHQQFSHPDVANVVTVPHSLSDLKPATVQQIVKDAKLDYFELGQITVRNP